MTTEKSGAGPSSRFTRRDIFRLAHRYHIGGESQIALAREVGVSASYMARLLKKGFEDGWLSLRLESTLSEADLELEARSTSPDQDALTIAVNGTRFCLVLDTERSAPHYQAITIGNRRITITIE